MALPGPAVSRTPIVATLGPLIRPAALAAAARRDVAGTLPGSTAIDAVEGEGANGVSQQLPTSDMTLRAPCHLGPRTDRLGGTVGRVADYSDGARDGARYRLVPNDTGHAELGRLEGIDERIWRTGSTRKHCPLRPTFRHSLPPGWIKSTLTPCDDLPPFGHSPKAF